MYSVRTSPDRLIGRNLRHLFLYLVKLIVLEFLMEKLNYSKAREYHLQRIFFCCLYTVYVIYRATRGAWFEFQCSSP